MSFNIPINQVDPTAPTPQNTPLTHAPIAQGLSRPTVPDISEDNEPEEEEPTGAIQQAMLGLVHGKLSGLIGKSSGYVESLPVEVKKNVEALKGVQVKQIELQNQYKRECLELEKKVCFIIIYPLLLCRGWRGFVMGHISRRRNDRWGDLILLRRWKCDCHSLLYIRVAWSGVYSSHCELVHSLFLRGILPLAISLPCLPHRSDLLTPHLPFDF